MTSKKVRAKRRTGQHWERVTISSVSAARLIRRMMDSGELPNTPRMLRDAPALTVESLANFRRVYADVQAKWDRRTKAEKDAAVAMWVATRKLGMQ